jgi:hypothetical protein
MVRVRAFMAKFLIDFMVLSRRIGRPALGSGGSVEAIADVALGASFCTRVIYKKSL